MTNYVWWYLMSVVPPPVITRKLLAHLQEFSQQARDIPYDSPRVPNGGQSICDGTGT